MEARPAAGGGFGACREWSPDPLLRDTLRSLPPAPACLTLHGPHEPLPHHARRVATPRRTPYPVHAGARFTGSGLRLELDWLPDAARTVTATPPPALAEQLHQLLRDLAQAAGAPIPSAFAPTPQQTALFTGADARPGTGRHVEQLVWVWHGPLDTDRFTAAWQSVFDHESVLRTAFLGGARPQLMVHSRVTVEITRRLHRAGDWSPLLERDRLRGFDLRRPGALRLMLLEPGPARPTAASLPTRIVLTYHRALIDTWSAHLLLREFYRAYLAGGTLPGGERRPDLRDYSAWLAAQDRGAGREFTARTTPPAPPASRPARPAPATGLSGVGRARLRLDAAETSRLAHWAGRWGTTESSVLQAVWAMLIYRACGAGGPAPVFFAVSVPGRGIPLDGADRMPGPLRNALPVHIEVDPAHTVPRLLRTLRDRALDMAAYEWVFGDFLHPDTTDTAATAAATAAAQAGTLIVFEDPPHPLHALHDDLAAHGIRAEFAGTVPARSVLPLGLLAHHDDTGGLVVTTVHDRALLDESSYSGGNMSGDHPIAWCKDYQGGRAFYTGGGHTEESYGDTAFRRHLLGGIRWAAGMTEADCRPENGYTALFDGSSTSGWRQAGPGGFTLTDGSLSSYGGLGLLWYAAKEFTGSYSLKLDWKAAGDDNSGVFLGFPASDDPWSAVNNGYEIRVEGTRTPDRTTRWTARAPATRA
ncbi:condensation domain-containing protein [Streptomyces lasalocidi]|uniref:DUF1080 domain-containing protein n=1 Tax=Streptomyces lasalocidi TaxID=324833 RepID=A0A4U5WD76_STRLS|nr:condensation domain-containing protein [Streptomyces lasalocidi]TKS98780.1 DUF1080 domain-containing protein [Streptomyces lasalocidi]